MENERKIEVEYETNVNDFRRILIWYHWKRLLLEYSLMLVLGIPFCYFLGFKILSDGLVATGFFATFLMLLIINIYGEIYRRAEALSKIFEPAKTLFSENGLETITSSIHTNRAWESYAKIYETDSDFIFFQKENAFAGIPKRFFKNQAEIEELRQIIAAKLGVKAKLQN